MTLPDAPPPGVRRFGRLPDGRDVEVITLGMPGGLQADILTYGANLHRLAFPVRGRARQLVLQLPTLADYAADTAYVGPVVGRFANRIAGGRFTLDGQAHQLTRNEGDNHLHGGRYGVGKRLWRLLSPPTATEATLGLLSPAGEEGYPGRLEITLGLTVTADALQVRLRATTDAPTPVNLTYHPYINLGGQATSHWLRIPASRYLPVLPDLIPTGELLPVADTPFDFRRGRVIAQAMAGSHPQLSLAGGFDHCWVLDADADCHCELRSASDDLALKIRASGPGLQFYSGQYLARTHGDIGTGLALEPQGFPDAPRHAAFPDSVLRPGQTYRADMEFRLSAR